MISGMGFEGCQESNEEWMDGHARGKKVTWVKSVQQEEVGYVEGLHAV